MNNTERNKIISFIDALLENDYNKAGKELNFLIKENIKRKIKKSKNSKPFDKFVNKSKGKSKNKSSKHCHECDEEE